MKETMDKYDQYKSKPLSLKDMVAISEGSVVSKMILKKKAGNLTLFAFDSGQGLSEHTAPYDAVIQVIEGEARITIGGEQTNVAAGETIIMPAAIPHAVYAEKPFKMLLIMIRSEE